MNSWNEDDLRAIAESHDLYISPFREDGTTYGTPTRCGPSSSTARSMSAPPTGSNPAGTEPP
jgi:hypothetical protein